MSVTGGSLCGVYYYDGGGCGQRHAGMRNVADKLAALLKSPNVEASMALQAVKNLFFVGEWFAAQLSDGDEGHESEDEEQDEAEDDADDTQGQGQSDALPWLFSKLSYQARSAQIARRNKSTAPVRDTIFCANTFPLTVYSHLLQANWPLWPLSVLRFFAAMTSFMEAMQVERLRKTPSGIRGMGACDSQLLATARDA